MELSDNSANCGNSIPSFSIDFIASLFAPAANLFLSFFCYGFNLYARNFLSGYTNVIAVINPVIGSAAYIA